jgi:Ala-tRNA(Pro) deacylase
VRRRRTLLRCVDCLEHDPEKACPGLDPGWKPVFQKDHAPPNNESADRFNLEAIALGNGGRAMSIALTLQRYLDQNVTYEVIQHEPTMSSTRTAEVCHVSGDRVAKAIVLRRDGGYLLAVLPASHHIHLQDLRMQLDDKVDLATEDEIAQLFRDCARGAVPAVGECYGLDVIVDDSIDSQREVYLEGGDHATLIRLGGAQFARLTANAWHGHFTTHD